MAERTAVDHQSLLGKVLQTDIFEVDVPEGCHLLIVSHIEEAGHDTLGRTGNQHTLVGRSHHHGTALNLQGHALCQLYRNTALYLEGIPLGHQHVVGHRKRRAVLRHTRAFCL